MQKKLDIEKRQREQQLAFRKYKHTRYSELKLKDGRVLKSAKVTNVTPVKVSFMHENGVAAVEYLNLPEEIRGACKYDDELEYIELTRQAKLHEQDIKLSRKKALAAAEKVKEQALAQHSTMEYSQKVPEVKPKSKVRPWGNVTVRLVRSRHYGSYHATYRTYEATVTSNVDAVLSGSNGYDRISAGVAFRTTFTTWSRFSVRLVTKDTGKLLDEETQSRRTGLGGSGGL